ncbi:MAG: heparinase II/III family protein, partial [Bacteroidales bacterium]|nr:heparinase II/III family protein [Bacteroidales bacterium]
AKGGHNAESHNHNDVGSYVVYYNAQPLLIDVGVGTYTSQTFGKGRYDIWAMQSGYHNLPKINGVDQKDGRQYKAKDLAYTNKGKQVTFSLDIAGAYPKEAGVESWKRTFSFTKNKQITITENYRLKEYKASTEIILMTCCEPIITDKGILLKTTDGERMLLFDKSLTPVIEHMEITDARLLTSWKPDLWRIRLKIVNQALSDVVTYTIK